MSQASERHSMARRIANGFVLAVNLLLCAGLLLSAFSGYISPVESKYAALMMYTFPGWLLGVLIAFVLDLILWRRTAMIAGISMLLCINQIHDYSPLNIPRGAMSEAQRQRSFTLMSYNVMNFLPQNWSPNIYSNEQLDYVIAQEPDVACIIEARCLAPDDKENHITQEQLTDLKEIYPYILIEGESFALLSKFKAEGVPIGFPKDDFKSGDIAGIRLYIHDQVVNLFMVHLRSFAFSYDERDLFKEVTEGANRNNLTDARFDLLPKVTAASSDRTRQYEWLVKCLRKFGGENVIVCGDFNDPPGCYGLHMLESESKLKQVYSETGFGPMITYNANNFFFRIDHVLYRGALKPYAMSRGDIKASDHYPLTVTFITE